MSLGDTQLSPRDDSYENDEQITVTLCDVIWDSSGIPAPNFGSILFELPIVGKMTITQQAKFSETEIKGSKGMTRIELQKFQTRVASFRIQLVGDDDDSGQSALDKFGGVNEAFLKLDSSGRNQIYGVRHPLITKAGIELCFLSGCNPSDEEGSDLIEVQMELKEVLQTQFARSRSGSGKKSNSGSDSSTPNGDKADDEAKKKDGGLINLVKNTADTDIKKSGLDK